MGEVSLKLENLDDSCNASPAPCSTDRIEIKIEEVNENESVTWTHHNTLTLIDGYGKHKKEVGSFQIKSMKKLWEVLSVEVNQKHNTSFSPANCENRWRVVERNYKKYRENNKKTGRPRKMFEYALQMDRVSGNNNNIHPIILLSTDTVSCNPTTWHKIDAGPPEASLQGEPTLGILRRNVEDFEAAATSSETRKRKRADAQSDTLELMRQEKKQFYEELLKIQKEKLQIDREKLLAQCKRNELISERNELLKHYLQTSDLPNPFL